MACSGKQSTSNNKKEKNGVDNGIISDDDILEAHLRQYAKENLKVEHRLGRLCDELKYDIKLRKLAYLNAKFGIPTSRKMPSLDVANQLLMEQLDADPSRERGVEFDTVAPFLIANDPDGTALRFPGKCPPLKCVALMADDPLHQVHCDGHEKLAAQGLEMGGVGIPIYLYVDKCTGGLLVGYTLPNVHKRDVIEHTYLDLVMATGNSTYILCPRQLVTDKGSEVGGSHNLQVSFRTEYAPSVNTDKYPPHIAVRSVHNTPIEKMWNIFSMFTGHNLKSTIISGCTSGVYHCEDGFHPSQELDKFINYWNDHPIRKQKNKKMPSGATPRDVWLSPDYCGVEHVGFPIPAEVIQAKRDALRLTREEAYCWVGEDFKKVAKAAYHAIGLPVLTISNGWSVFQRMETVLRAQYHFE
ncbi:hypothetical protein PENSPDRAFT_672386 [Peniophora sp. CONT]|nr:hypothetical protein PENSPDRAFT_672386 [Peniophora sp. CONT]